MTNLGLLEITEWEPWLEQVLELPSTLRCPAQKPIKKISKDLLRLLACVASI